MLDAQEPEVPVTNPTWQTIGILISNGGRVSTSNEFQIFLLSHGIRYQQSIHHSQQQKMDALNIKMELYVPVYM